ncbi:MAG: helix-turn-helix domain-containing protein [Gemmatimonadaceae bacterium]
MAVAIDIKQLGAELRRQRADRDMNLRDVEAETGISATTLSRIERGSGNPEIPVIEKLATWLGTVVQTGGRAEASVRTDADLKRVIAVHLRANKKLPEKVARSIAETFEVIMRIETKKAADSKARR